MPKQQCRNPRSSRLRLGAIITIVLVLVAVTASAQASSTANNDTASQQQDPAVAMYATEYSVEVKP